MSTTHDPVQRHARSPLQVLRVDASARYADSVSRALATEVVRSLQRRVPEAHIAIRDLAAEPLPYVDQDWIEAAYTAPEARSRGKQHALAVSDRLVAELHAADVLVIGAPVYNFGVPAALKAWVDLVARAGVTFRYTEHGPQGLLNGKRAYVAMASGGVALGSAVDFASGYLRHVLGFLGIADVHFVAADQLMLRDNGVQIARQRIAELFAEDEPRIASRA